MKRMMASLAVAAMVLSSPAWAAASSTMGPTASDGFTAKDKEKEKDVVPYPLDTCLVTDNKLGSMGDPVTIVHENRELKFCCSPCVKKFEKEPGKYLPKLDEKKES